MKVKTHSPWIANSEQYYIVKRPKPAELSNVKLGDWTEVAFPVGGKGYEPCQLEVVLKCKCYWMGIVRTELKLVRHVHVGDLVKFHPVNVIRITQRQEFTI